MRTVVMSTPDKNALSTELMRWLIAELRQAGGEPIFLTGTGNVFSAGLHLKEVASLDTAGMERYLATLEELVEALFTYEGPTIAWVNGHAIAGGCILALACDLRLGSANAELRVGLNEIPLGLRFPPRTWRLVRARLPSHHLDEVILEGALHDPEQAVRLGLLDGVVADAAEAQRRAERLAASPRAAYVAAKRALRAGVLVPTPDEETHYRDEVLPTWSTPAFRERIAAVLRR